MKTSGPFIVCEPYTGTRAIKQEIKSGFASISQRHKLVGLTVLVDHDSAHLKVKKGQKVFLVEEDLHAHAFAKKTYQCSEISEIDFALIEANFVKVVG